ncbi:MAG: 4-hydroxy-tetrahydrodipicolinate reductase [Deltaproteobacteria bacterium]
MTQVVVSGAAGRLGRRIVARALADERLQVAAALVRSTSAVDGRAVDTVVGEVGGGLTFSSDEAAIAEGRVLVEVATKAAALAHAARAAEVGAPLLMATTGFDAAERATLEGYAAKIPVVIAPNLSMGIAVLTDLVKRASKALAAYDLEILELHHNKKRDAPSGTAWALGRAAAEAREQDIERDAICARAGETGARGREEIGMMAIRGGDIIGEHTVYLVSDTERVELTHRAATRDTFAAGAIAAAHFLGNAGAGLYTMNDVLGL